MAIGLAPQDAWSDAVAGSKIIASIAGSPTRTISVSLSAAGQVWAAFSTAVANFLNQLSPRLPGADVVEAAQVVFQYGNGANIGVPASANSALAVLTYRVSIGKQPASALAILNQYNSQLTALAQKYGSSFNGNLTPHSPVQTGDAVIMNNYYVDCLNLIYPPAAVASAPDSSGSANPSVSGPASDLSGSVAATISPMPPPSSTIPVSTTSGAVSGASSPGAAPTPTPSFPWLLLLGVLFS